MSLSSIFLYGFYKGSVSNYKTYDYTKLPNSCFLEALIHASKASLVLKSEITPQIYSSIFGYTYKYNNDLYVNGQKSSMTYGHAICIFEYKNKLWTYDMNYGTMPVGNSGNRNMYTDKLKSWAEKTYNIKIDKCFVVDDWAVVPVDITEY